MFQNNPPLFFINSLSVLKLHIIIQYYFKFIILFIPTQCCILMLEQFKVSLSILLLFSISVLIISSWYPFWIKRLANTSVCWRKSLVQFCHNLVNWPLGLLKSQLLWWQLSIAIYCIYYGKLVWNIFFLYLIMSKSKKRNVCSVHLPWQYNISIIVVQPLHKRPLNWIHLPPRPETGNL